MVYPCNGVQFGNKEIKYWYTPQHGWTSKVWCCDRTNHKRPNGIVHESIYTCKVFRRGKWTETESRLAVTKGWGDGENKGRVWGQYKGYEVPFWSYENGLKSTVELAARCREDPKNHYIVRSKWVKCTVEALCLNIVITIHTQVYKMNPEHLFIPQSEKTIKDFWDHVTMNSENNLKTLSLLKDRTGTPLQVLCAVDWTQCAYTPAFRMFQ